MNKAVIFDLDGTILHTVPDITDNINLMLKKFGYPLLTEKEVAAKVGSGARRLVYDCIGKDITEKELDERLEYYNKLYTESTSPKTRLFDGVEELILRLEKDGYKLAIMTNKPQETTDTVKREHLSKFNFLKIVGSSNGVKCKPDKTATEDLIKFLGVDKENVWFLGDGETDALTAINAGINGISVLWGYREKEQLIKAGATVFASTPKEVYKIITGKDW